MVRGQILVLPVGNTFLYVDPIYIQSTEGSMPQLKKIVLATGNRLIYADSYDEALADLSGGARPAAQQPTAVSAAAAPAGGAQPTADPRVQRIREHMRRYKDLASQGKWSEAGKELEAIEQEIKQ